MKLKKKIDALSDVDDNLQQFYKENDEGDGFVLTLETDAGVSKAKLDEFRDNNRKLARQVKELKADMSKFEGVDPDKWDEAKKALEKVQNMKDQKLIDAGKLDEVVNARTETMRKDSDAKVKAAQEARDAATKEASNLRTELGTLTIDTGASENVAKVGAVRKGAMPDILARAHKTFKINDEGKMEPRTPDGDILYDENGDPLSMDKWAKNLIQDAPFLFEGAKGSESKGGKQVRTQQGQKVIKRNPTAFGKNIEDIAAGKTVVADAE